MDLQRLLLIWVLTSTISLLLGYLWVSSLRRPGQSLGKSIYGLACSFLIALCHGVFYLACYLELVAWFLKPP